MLSITSRIKQRAAELQFDLAGVASAQDPFLAQAIARYSKWLEAGHGATMAYLSRHLDLKTHPEKLLPGCRTILCVALNYAETPLADDPERALVSIYTRGRDYHLVIGEKLEALAEFIKSETGAECRPFVDSEPVLDRFWAWRAGLGWLGKNTMLIHRRKGSFLFLGGLLTPLDLEIDEPKLDHCGRCRKCIDACPTQAILEERAIDSRKCIGYHTIENRGEVPEEIASKTGRWIAGCDICQTVCPWNDPIVPGLEFDSTNPAYNATLAELARWSKEEFKSHTKDVAMGRMKYEGFQRNVDIAIRNSKR